MNIIVIIYHTIHKLLLVINSFLYTPYDKNQYKSNVLSFVYLLTFQISYTDDRSFCPPLLLFLFELFKLLSVVILGAKLISYIPISCISKQAVKCRSWYSAFLLAFLWSFFNLIFNLLLSSHTRYIKI